MDLFGVGLYFVDLSADDLQLLPDGRKGFFVHIEMKEHMIHIFADGVDLVDHFDEFLEICAVGGVFKAGEIAFYEVDHFSCRGDLSFEKGVRSGAVKAVFVFVIDIKGISQLTVRTDVKFKLIETAVDFTDFGRPPTDGRPFR